MLFLRASEGDELHVDLPVPIVAVARLTLCVEGAEALERHPARLASLLGLEARSVPRNKFAASWGFRLTSNSQS